MIISFETPVFINEIHIYESLNPGSVVKLEMLESQRSKKIKIDNFLLFTYFLVFNIRNLSSSLTTFFFLYLDKWWTMWQRKTSQTKQSVTHHIFKPILRRYHIQSNTIRITFDPRYTDQIGIQAISNINIFNFLKIHPFLFFCVS